MSTPTNHHYVPKCYLKHISCKKSFYLLDKKYKHTSPATPKGVCYIPNYFKISREENLLFNSINDPYYIERE